jgi:hypothetical protein
MADHSGGTITVHAKACWHQLRTKLAAGLFGDSQSFLKRPYLEEIGCSISMLALSILPWTGKRCVPTQNSDTIAFIVRLHFALQTSSIVANN